jgi:pimeloyl-ACP methyl ester carboxylesterase
VLQIDHRFIETNGIRMHIAEAGSGPLVLLCHGFPESWYSWRHQFEPPAAAGFHAVAPDMRGYGQTDRPEAIDAYTLLHLVGDMVGVLDALGSETAVIVGHDWGAPVAWNASLLRPDRFRAVIGLSVPFRPRGKMQPTTVMPRTEQAVFYQLYFQTPGMAEADLEADVHASMRDVLLRLSGDVPPLPGPERFSMVPLAGGLRVRMSDYQSRALPPWLSEADLDFYVGEFSRSGFRGGLNWYRNIDRNWALLSPFAGAKIVSPALYLAGDQDVVLSFPGMNELVTNLKAHVPKLRQTIILPGCGHWIQQERHRPVNAAMLSFLQSL